MSCKLVFVKIKCLVDLYYKIVVIFSKKKKEVDTTVQV